MRSLMIIFLITVIVSSANAQKTIANVNLQLSFPQGEYKSNFPKTGVGMRLSILRRLKEDGPISIGGELGYLLTGSDTRYFDIFYGGFYDRYKVSATNNVLSLAFKARADLMPAERPVKVFVETTVGANLFFSSVNIERETYYSGSQSVGGDNSKGYWAFIWGPGIGIEIPVDKRKQAAVVVKGTYLFGANTTYLTDPYIDNNGDTYFTRHESKTNMILGELGIRLFIPSRSSRRR
jgi:hypothetical protein